MDGNEFVLPGFRGVERAIDEVKEFGLRTGREKLITLDREGGRRYTIEGDEHSVVLPPKATGTCQGLLIVHGHPGMPTELSSIDMECVWGTKAWGNLAASCVDETVSWARGINRDWTGDFISLFLGQYMYESKSQKVKEKLGLDRLCGDQEPSTSDYVRYVHLLNKELVACRFYVDYHVRLGEVAKGMLEGVV
jgi:proteasome lid subunit RPN8/RPN11